MTVSETTPWLVGLQDVWQGKVNGMIGQSTEFRKHSISCAPEREIALEVEHTARQWVADNCAYQYYFRDVEYHFDEGVLTLCGRVPSFYLKQVLQAVLGEAPQIDRIENHVEVVSSVGLSSSVPT